jgi:uncharacterized tellurite resistance protein B-like protein
MLDQLKKLFGSVTTVTGVLEQQEPLELATAALLLELSRADFSESVAEKEAISQLLQKRFKTSLEATDKLMADAARRADRAVSLHEFTHRLNRELPEADKLAIVEMLWQVSNADGRIDKHEEQLVQRIAGLLHISDKDRMRLKLKTIVAG